MMDGARQEVFAAARAGDGDAPSRREDTARPVLGRGSGAVGCIPSYWSVSRRPRQTAANLSREAVAGPSAGGSAGEPVVATDLPEPREVRRWRR